jgi:hypothetical protein
MEKVNLVSVRGTWPVSTLKTPLLNCRTKGKQRTSTPLPSIIASSQSFSETKNLVPFGKISRFVALNE